MIQNAELVVSESEKEEEEEEDIERHLVGEKKFLEDDLFKILVLLLLLLVR